MAIIGALTGVALIIVGYLIIQEAVDTYDTTHRPDVSDWLIAWGLILSGLVLEIAGLVIVAYCLYV